MANYCDCHLIIVSEDVEMINLLFQIAHPKQKKYGVMEAIQGLAMKKKQMIILPELLEYLSPMPTALAQQVGSGFTQGEPEWRKWRVENWGCPYDAEIRHSEILSASSILINFDAPFAPPISALNRGAKRLHFQFSISYFEPGSGLVGEANNDGNKEYLFNVDIPPDRQEIPGKLVKEFDLQEVYLIWKNEA